MYHNSLKSVPAAGLRQRVVPGLAAVTFISHDSWFAAATTRDITLSAQRANRVTAAGQAVLVWTQSVVVVQTALTVGSVRVVGAVAAVTSMTRGTVQSRVEKAFSALTIAVAC